MSDLLRWRHIENLADLRRLRDAIEASDPQRELLVRVDDIIRWTEGTLNSAPQKKSSALFIK